MAYSGSSEDKDKILALLRKAYTERSSALTQLKVAPQYDLLRSDSRFQQLLREVGLSDKQYEPGTHSAVD